MKDLKKYFEEHGEMSKMSYRIFEPLKSIEEIVSLVQKRMIHQAWAHRYGVEVTDTRKQETMMRTMSEKIEWLSENNQQIFGICRDFSLFTVALCRDNNIPARARCGFATYFEKDKYIDHWVVEYYDGEKWIMIDPQLDNFQKEVLDINFDTMNLSKNEFILGGDAWHMCRNEGKNPLKFGIFQWWGYDYLMCNMLLDAHALLKRPMHPWDKWEGIKSKEMESWTDEDYKTLDGLSLALRNGSFEELSEYLDNHKSLQLPKSLADIQVF